ncbi:MAG: S24 family peptidase [Verrucomicrobia bacterium]|nr:S24 family peptidase [Verrucomicrobiota bacterium]
MGAIQAGFPDEPTAHDHEILHIAPCAFGIRNARDAFALRACGDSMTGRPLFDGDAVWFDRSATPKNRDIVAALIDRKCPLRTF